MILTSIMQKWMTCSRNCKIPADFQFVNWHPLFPVGAFSCHNTGMNKTITLTENQYAIMLEIFQFVGSMDLYGDDTMDHADYQFDELWEKIVS